MSTLGPWAPASAGAFAPLRGDEPHQEPRPSPSSGAQRLVKTGIHQGAVVETDGPLDSSQNTSPTSYTKHAPTAPLKNSEVLPGWRPKSLRKTTFFAFAFVFVACIATLAALFAYSRSHQGLLTVDTHLHYLWTYTPTLFFTIAGACWSRVAYRILQMQPWRVISQSQTSMPEALLVDYVTPIALSSLFKAIKARHLLVVMVLLASIALQVVIILSTGLFDVEYLLVQKNGPISLLDNITGVAHDFSTISAGPDLTIYSIQNTNLSYPEGTTSLYAVPKLSYPAVSNATLTASVDVFASYLQCELASLHVEKLAQTSYTGGIHNGPQFTYSLSTKDCLVADQTVVGGMYLDYNYVGLNYDFFDTYGNTGAVTCSNNDSDVQDVRIRISVGLIHYNITWNGTGEDEQYNKSVVLPSSLSDIYTLSASTNLLCVPQYGLQTAEVTYATNQTIGSRQLLVQGPNSTSLRPLEGVTSQTLSKAIMDSVSASTTVISALYPDPNAEVYIVNGPSESEGGYFPTNADAFFTTMTQRYPPANGSSKSIWFDPQSLHNASSQFFGSVTAQFASQYLRRDVNDTVPGTAAIVEPRLVVFSAVFYVMEALLGFFSLAALILAWPAAKSITPIDPASIGGTTAMLCSDSELIDSFHRTGSYSLPELRGHLLGGVPSNKRTDPSRLRAFERKRKVTDAHRTGAGRDEATWWRPFVFQPFIREIILLIPLLAIVVLEITLHYSQNHNGLVSIGSRRHELYASRLVPAVVFSAIRMLLTALAFNVSLLTPFSTLRREPSAARFSLFDTPLARFPLQNLWSSAGKKQVALLCSVLMTSAAFFLVTISSGLFVTGDFTQSSNLTQLSWFQPTSTNDSAIHKVSNQYNLTEPLHYLQDNGEVIVHLVGNSIIELNLSYPAWTYDELAFPLLTISNTSTTNATDAASVSAQIPAVRADLQCDVLKNDETNISYAGTWDSSLGQNFTYQTATVQTSSPHGCDQTVEFQAYLPARLNTSKEGSVAPRPCSMMSNFCSNLVGIYGYATDEAFVNYSVISCKVSYEQVQSTATFELPNYVLSKNAPPTVDESETKSLNSSDVSGFLNAVFYFVAFYNTTLTTVNGYPTMDQVTSALIYGKDGVLPEELFQHGPEEYLIPSLKHLIRVMGAQYMSYFYRTVNSSMPLVDSTIPATLRMGPNYRLKQNATSTRILDALLAASWLFAVITVLTFRSRDVAKAKLGSLAATLALVADSEFVHDLQSYVQRDGGRGGEKDRSQQKSANIVQMEQKLSSEGYQFSLGWWQETGTPSPSPSSENRKATTRRGWGIDIGRSE